MHTQTTFQCCKVATICNDPLYQCWENNSTDAANNEGANDKLSPNTHANNKTITTHGNRWQLT